ncbi:7-dimethylallyltryptophan synthase [Escovopsis weberi]|uniref:7-dimethylallyltryptophan synthase n=1 Tax=Escovopsis weberi TaxID=150374 RepID=A0A0N0RU69_ESCWE|nr:7-dimethylallyltryptophan synthase [Escovopsis weberi]
MGSTDTTPWQTIADKSPFESEDEKYWFSKVGPLAGRMMQWAAYPPDEQIRVLTFIRDYLVASFGPRPSPEGVFHWKTALHYDHTPVQLSLNLHKSRKTLRTANVPICALSGTPADPANQQASIDAVRRQQAALPAQDLTWFDQCVERFFLPPEVAGALAASVPGPVFQQAVQCMISHDFPPRDVQCKVEFCPALRSMVGGRTLKQEIWDGIAALRLPGGGDGGGDKDAAAAAAPYARALAVLERFTDSPAAAALGVAPIFFAFDTVPKPGYPLSRLKVYYATRRTALADMLRIYTLDGLLGAPHGGEGDAEDIRRGVDALRRLWREVVAVPEGLGDDEDLPPNAHPCAAVIFNYEIWPGAEAPIPKIYIPAHHYGKGDLEIAEGMDRFFESEGLDERYKEEYTRCFVNSDGQVTAVHHDVSLSYKNGSPYITSYFKPQLHAKIE